MEESLIKKPDGSLLIKAEHLTLNGETIDKLMSSAKFIEGIHAIVPIHIIRNLNTKVLTLESEITELKAKLGDDK